MPTTIVRRTPYNSRPPSDDEPDFVKVVVCLIIFGGIAYFLFSEKPRRALVSHAASSPRSANENVSFGSFDDAPQRDTSPPPGYTIKGNISVTNGRKLYHVPGMRDYAETIIDTDRGERWFRTEAEAMQSGWQRASR